MFSDTLVLAALTDLIGVVVAIVFIIIYSINHLLSGKANQPPGRNQQRRPPEPAERPMRPAQPQPKPKDAVSQLNTEIEQFLKRAGQRRSEKPARDRAAGPPPNRPPKPPQPPARESLKEQAADVEPIERRGFDNVAASVEKHIANRSFSQRAEHLADDIAQADEQMEAHLQQAFSHKVGTLAGESPQAPAQPMTDAPSKVTDEGPAPAAALAAMMATPQGMRQAILLGEILVRPEHRW